MQFMFKKIHNNCTSIINFVLQMCIHLYTKSVNKTFIHKSKQNIMVTGYNSDIVIVY